LLGVLPDLALALPGLIAQGLALLFGHPVLPDLLLAALELTGHLRLGDTVSDAAAEGLAVVLPGAFDAVVRVLDVVDAGHGLRLQNSWPRMMAHCVPNNSCMWPRILVD